MVRVLVITFDDLSIAFGPTIPSGNFSIFCPRPAIPPAEINDINR
jgi:hypothetical protein